ncbi:MAG: pyridoxamine 5'-phosphate oxidase family protein [Nitrososphaeraceae archaeon]
MLKILNASPGFGGPLNEQETTNFLSSVKLNIHLGTIDERGDANIHPAWFYYDPSKEMIYVETSKQAKKTHNLRKGGNIYFCIDDPNPPYKGVRGKGSVRIHEDIAFNVPIAEKIMVKYLGKIDHPMAQALLDMQKKGQSVIIEISPKYYSTWDYSKQ